MIKLVFIVINIIIYTTHHSIRESHNHIITPSHIHIMSGYTATKSAQVNVYDVDTAMTAMNYLRLAIVGSNTGGITTERRSEADRYVESLSAWTARQDIDSQARKDAQTVLATYIELVNTKPTNGGRND